MRLYQKLLPNYFVNLHDIMLATNGLNSKFKNVRKSKKVRSYHSNGKTALTLQGCKIIRTLGILNLSYTYSESH